MFEKGKVIIRVHVSYYSNQNCIIKSDFKDFESECLFFLFMVDRVLTDIEDLGRVKNLAAMIYRYFNDINFRDGEAKKTFGSFQFVNSTTSELTFEVRYELCSKNVNEGKHFYIWLETLPPFVSTIEGKYAVSTMLYLIHWYKTLREKEIEVVKNVYAAMLQYYLKNGFPTSTTLTIAPSTIINLLENHSMR